MSNRSGIKYPRINIRVSKENIRNINDKCMSSGSTVTTAILLQGHQVQLAVSLPVTFSLTVKALSISIWASLRCRWVWLIDLILSLALFLLPSVALLSLIVRLVLDSQYLATACTLLDVSLYCF